MELATGTAVMAIGGFTGGDPYPTLEQFQAHVAAGEIRYFVAGGGVGGPGGRGGAGTAMAEWVQQHYPAQTVGGRTVHDLAAPTR